MKLRFHRNSLRFRLSPAEVQQLRQTGSITQTIRFAPNSQLTYILQSRPAPALRATFTAGKISIDVPAAALADWADGDQVQIAATQDSGGGATLQILIEKEFECLEPGMNDPDERLYPNPNSR